MKITIGRDPDSTIVISEDYDIVSNEHADIKMEGSDIVFTDHSSNGTIINGQKIHGQSVKIFPHDKIMLAGVCQVDWSQINQYIPHSGRPTVIHNIRRNVDMPNSQDHPFTTQQEESSQWQPSETTEELVHSRPTELHNPHSFDRGNSESKMSEWESQRPPKLTEQWNSDNERLGIDSSRPYGNENNQNITISQRDQRELRQWNWGAFFFGWLWGVCHKVWFALIQLAVALIPSVLSMMGIRNLLVLVVCSLICLGVSVWLGLKGTRVAWDNGAWASIDQMRRSRSKWNIAALVCFVLSVVLALVMIVFFIDIILTLI